jgi:Asp/Glu/hydantoin racemase
MKKKVALIHTSLVFIEREPLLFQLLEEILPDVTKVNIIEDQMLQAVLNNRTIPANVIKRMCFYVLSAEAMGANVIFNTCSSLGPAIDIAKPLVDIPIVKIDDAMAEKTARDGNRIAVIATVPTTLRPTSNLIKEKAEALDKNIEIKEVLTQGAFDLLMSGDTEQHDDMVISQAISTSAWADTIVLAQCSMARLAPKLSKETKLPVLSSPKLGVEHLRDVLDAT